MSQLLIIIIGHTELIWWILVWGVIYTYISTVYASLFAAFLMLERPTKKKKKKLQKNWPTCTWLRQCLACIPGLPLEFGLFPKYFNHIWISVVIAWLELILMHLQTDNLDTRQFCFSTEQAMLGVVVLRIHGRHALWLALIMMNFKASPCAAVSQIRSSRRSYVCTASNISSLKG